MALKPLRPCAHAGCRAVTRDVWCPKHKPKREDRRSAESAEWHKWYRLPIFAKRLRPEQLLREPFCRECAKYGVRKLASDVDHIIPHRGDWTLFVDPNNLQSLCHRCHSRKTATEVLTGGKNPQGSQR